MAYVRRKSSAFTRGKSRYRGVSGHSGRWEARIGTFGGRKNVRLNPENKLKPRGDFPNSLYTQVQNPNQNAP